MVFCQVLACHLVLLKFKEHLLIRHEMSLKLRLEGVKISHDEFGTESKLNIAVYDNIYVAKQFAMNFMKINHDIRKL